MINKTFRLGILSIIMVILLSLTVFGSGQNYGLEWGEFGDQSFSSQYFSALDSVWDGTASYSSINDGSTFQPLALDLDNDGEIEILATDGGFIKIWGESGNVISLEIDLNVGGSQTVAMSGIQEFDSDDYEEFILIHSSFNISIYEYNGTALNLEQTNVTSETAVSGVRCGNFSGSLACYWANDNGDIVEYGIAANGYANYNISNSDIFDTSRSEHHAPAMFDIDIDGNQELAFICDPSDNGIEGVCVWDQNSGSVETTFSSDGILEVHNDNNIVNSVVIFNVDGAGTNEIIVTYRDTGAGATDNDAHVKVLQSDGTTKYTSKIMDIGGAGEDGRVSNCLIGDFVNDSGTDLCCPTVSTGTNDEFQIVCLDITDGSNLVTHTNGTSGSDAFFMDEFVSNIFTSAQFNSEKDNIILGGAILRINDDGTINYIETGAGVTSDRTSKAIPVDLNGDGNQDIVSMRSGFVFASFSDFTNSPPTLYTNFSYGGFGANYDYTQPICVNDSLTFTAQDDGGAANGNYINDADDDTERIVSDCGGLHDSIQNGTLHLTSPSFSCVFNETGTYLTTLYLQDQANTDDFTQFASITVNVITGNTGSDCSLTGFNPATTAPLTVVEDSAFDTLFNILFDGDTTIKLIIGIAAVIGLFLYSLYLGAGTIGAIFVGVTATILMTILGLINGYILFLLLFGCLIVGILALAFGGGRNGGEV